jgi:hypothetical protein
LQLYFKMDFITKKTTCFLFRILFLLLVITSVAQHSYAQTPQYKNFNYLLSQINMNFTFPEGFKEIKAINNEAFPFDYAMEIPGADFEIWISVNTQRENEKYLVDRNVHISNPDSLYIKLAEERVDAFITEKSYLMRSIPKYILDRYNADAGRTYLLNIKDSPLTRHYKFALLTILQKDHTGTVLAICFTNIKGPEFFKNLSKVSSCLKFKP